MSIPKQFFNLEQILEGACNGNTISNCEIMFLLSLTRKDQIDKVFRAARHLRVRYFGNKIFLYGFIYFSTYCRNNCSFCLYNRSNSVCKRYRKQLPEIVDAAYSLAESGVHLIDLTMGEDPYLLNEKKGFEKLVRIVEIVKKSTGLPLMISPGVISVDALNELKKAGVDWYACYQETFNQKLFNKLRIGQNFAERFKIKLKAKKIGMLVEEGLLTGVGESKADLVASFNLMRKMFADQARVMSFIPQMGTNMSNWPSPPRLRELLIIAVMRLIFPNLNIPASLDIDGLAGLKQRINAGANVVTSLIPPKTGLQGVSQSSLDIEEGNRIVSSVIPILETCGLTQSTQVEYSKWIADRHAQKI